MSLIVDFVVDSSRAQKLDRGPEKDLCTIRWQTAHDITSLKACCDAFEACQEGDVYDLGEPITRRGHARN